MESRTEIWVPRTRLGRMVQEGRISSLEEIFIQGMKIRESMIVDILEPDLEQEVLNIGLIQKQTDAGEQSRFRALVVVGNLNGYVGLGSDKAKQVRTAIQKATVEAKMNLFPVKRGCGSWECGCGHSHTLPFKVSGKCGSVRVELLPAPRGVGLVAGETAKTILGLVGIQDCWTRTFGSTRTIPSFAYATYFALRETYRVMTPRDWAR
ncbi:MAG: 30S ribosomal protein S5 [Candidatus Bathyarchaeota archaeon]|nr:MAG: 30S ribosomal protein S5 [Candidatus Bathyarchaeota archaeon]